MLCVYADTAATTPISPAALKAMNEVYENFWENPSGLYSSARRAAGILESSRSELAGLLGCHADELFFTSGGTESDCLAVAGAVSATRRRRGGGIKAVVSAIEHRAVLAPFERLAEEGVEVVVIPPDKDGIINEDVLASAVDDRTVLTAVMTANNEVGTIQPIGHLAETAHKHGSLFFTDAVQAAGRMPLDFHGLGVDLAAVSAHKFNGPRGIGALYVSRGIDIEPLIRGGGQERGLRSGTQNVAAARGMACALSEAVAALEESHLLREKRDILIQRLLNIPGARLNGCPVRRLDCNVNVSFEGIDSESLILQLDLCGIYASAGAACSSGSRKSSHVLTAMGLDAGGALRLTLPRTITREELDYIAENVERIVATMRELPR